MTLPANSRAFSDSLPPADAQDVANKLREVLAATKEGNAKLYAHPTGQDPVEINLHPLVSNALMELLRHIGSGDAVTLIPINKMLTTQQAADILNVSRPFLVKLLESSEIAFETVGRHRRIKAQDLFDYKLTQAQKRERALKALAESDADLI